MPDQADGLRRLAREKKVSASGKATAPAGGATRVIAVTSGKGGVGKTNLVVNLGIAMSQAGKRVVVMDADLGLANIDVLLGLSPKYNLEDVIRGRKSLPEIVLSGPGGIRIVPASSGVEEFANLDSDILDKLIGQIVWLGETSDILLVDTGAGMSRNVTRFVLSAQEVILVTTPEPTAITDAYVMIKVIVTHNPEARISLITNMVMTREAGRSVYDRLNLLSKRFLGRGIDYLGPILYDRTVPKSVGRQTPYILAAPYALASATTRQVAGGIIGRSLPGTGLRRFFQRMSHILDRPGE
jgi:flagellar biosynthesis protein FlhG